MKSYPDETETLRQFGYLARTLKPKSEKHIIVTCEGCKLSRAVRFNQHDRPCYPCSVRARTKKPKKQDTIRSTVNERRTREVFGILAPEITERFYPRIIVNCDTCKKEREVCYRNKDKPCRRCAYENPQANERRTRERLEGQVFGRLTVVSYTGKKKSGQLTYECVCRCGRVIITQAGSLKDGNTRSCGCFKNEISAARWKGTGPQKTIGHGLASRNALLCQYKRGARQRGHSWELTNEQFFLITKQNCYYCGTVPAQVKQSHSHNGPYVYNGIDRLDSSVGYLVGNCVAACGSCNRAKRAMHVDVFLSLVERIYQHRITQRKTA